MAMHSRRLGVSISTVPASTEPTAIDVEVSGSLLRVVLADGREVAAPLEWFPRLRDATAVERRNWRLIGRGRGIHWPDVDEDVSVSQLLGGPS
jgi:hypothetical protein